MKKSTKKIAQEHQLFLLWRNKTPLPPSTTARTTITTITRTTPITVRKTITIVLPKKDANFNYVTVKEEKALVLKKVLLRQNTHIKNIHRRTKYVLPKLKDEKSTRELVSGNSSCVTCFVQNLSKLWTYERNTCKSWYIFPNSFAGFAFFAIFFSFLFRHFTVVHEATLNMNFYP